MNRKNLTAAVLAGLAGAAGIVGSAQAVNINADGIGQVLIYPYYTTRGGNATFFSVVNTTGEAKALKVRFLESMNSLEVLDFNLYLSEWDVWAAQVFDDAGEPSIVVPDTSCTVPYIHAFPGSKQKFLTFALDDGGPDDADRTADGHFEIIETGQLNNQTQPNFFIANQLGGSAWAATHVNGVPPDSWNQVTGAIGPCEQLIGAWSTAAVANRSGYWLGGTTVPRNSLGTGRVIDLSTHSGGLFGGAGIVNVAEGSLYTYDAIALNDWTHSLWTDTQTPGLVPIHQNPGNLLPNLNSGDVLTAEVPISKNIGASFMLTPSGFGTVNGAFARGVDAVSFTLQRYSVMNEYTTQTALLGKTEWVLTFPTKVFYVFEDVAGKLAGIPVPHRPFSSIWDEDKVESCDEITFTVYDREERLKAGVDLGPIVSPEPPDPTVNAIELCYEANVIQFGSSVAPSAANPTSLLGAVRGISIDNALLGSSFDQGWMSLNFVNTFAGSDNLGGLVGRPVTGFRVSEFTNTAAAAGVKATYGGLWQHKHTRMCSTGGTQGGAEPTPSIACAID